MKIRSLFTILLSAAVVVGAVVTLDVFAANFRNDSRAADSDVQSEFVCEAKGCTRTGVHGHTLCPVSDCLEASIHVHNGTCYYAHSMDDGHAYHVCGVDGCTLAEEHTHNSCGIEGCTQIEQHTHNSCGVTGCNIMESHSHHNGASGGSGHHSGHGGHH